MRQVITDIATLEEFHRQLLTIDGVTTKLEKREVANHHAASHLVMPAIETTSIKPANHHSSRPTKTPLKMNHKKLPIALTMPCYPLLISG